MDAKLSLYVEDATLRNTLACDLPCNLAQCMT